MNAKLTHIGGLVNPFSFVLVGCPSLEIAEKWFNTYYNSDRKLTLTNCEEYTGGENLPTTSFYNEDLNEKGNN